MSTFIKGLIETVSRPRLVEFDYQDDLGFHHGRCYVRCLWAGSSRVKRIMSSFGYTNIHIA